MSRRTDPSPLDVNRPRDGSAQARDLPVLLLDLASRQLGATTVLILKERAHRVKTVHGSARNSVGSWLKNQGWFWTAIADCTFPFAVANTNGHPLFQPIAKAQPSGPPHESISSCLAVSVASTETDRGARTILAAFGSTPKSWSKDDLEFLETHAAAIHAHETILSEMTQLKTERNEHASLANGWRRLAEQTLDLVTRQGLDRLINKVSILHEALLGQSPCDLIGKKLSEFVHPEDRSRFEERFEAIVDGREVSRISHRFRRKDDSYAWLETSVVAVFDPFTGGLAEVVSGSRDVTGRASEVPFNAERDRINRGTSRPPWNSQG